MQTWLIPIFEYLQKYFPQFSYPFLIWEEIHCLGKVIFSNKRAIPSSSYVALLSSAMINSQLDHNCLLPPQELQPAFDHQSNLQTAYQGCTHSFFQLDPLLSTLKTLVELLNGRQALGMASCLSL